LILTMATIVAVSPHLDDAVLSYGGRLAELCAAGNKTIVYTVFAGKPKPDYSEVATTFHKLWNLSADPVQARLDEDTAAVRCLGATTLHGPFLDAVYRKDGQGDWLIRPGGSVKGDQVIEEPALLADIACAVEDLITEHRPGLIITCSAIGNHVDHARTRDATLIAALRTSTEIHFWEDLPYSARNLDMPSLPLGVELADAHVEPVRPDAWRAKMSAVTCYASQHRMLMHSGTDIFDQLYSHAVLRGMPYGASRTGELTWGTTLHLPASPPG
jgi:LmbE family N-acetylglucosaminyl deacetylase